MIKIKFLRYDNNGTHGTLCEVPSHILGMYPDYDKNSMTKRQRVWSSKTVKANFGTHILQGLLKDNDFLRSYAPTWAIKGLKKYTSNLYISLYNSEDTIIPETPLAQVTEESQPVVVKFHPEKKERKTRVKKAVDEKKEKRISFKQMRTRINSKTKTIRALNHFEDPFVLRRFRGDSQSQAEKEHYDNVITQIFKSYKIFFEEVLESRNMPFFVVKEDYDVPYNYRDGGMTVEYLLVNNTENLPTEPIFKQDWTKVTLSWLTSRKCINKESRWSREYQEIMSTKRIGLSLNNSRDVVKSEVKSFKSMRESTFSGVIEKAFTDNNIKYTTLIENFKLAKSRLVTNKVEDEKLKNYITTNIIPLVDPEFIDNPSVNLKDKDFMIKVDKKSYRGFEVLEIGREVDNFEELTYRIEFFDNKSRRVNTAEDAIEVLKVMLSTDLKSIIDVFSRVSKM